MNKSSDKDSTNNHESEQDHDDLTLTDEEEELLKQKLEELRKRDPFIYR
jgi:hypothetical protein